MDGSIKLGQPHQSNTIYIVGTTHGYWFDCKCVLEAYADGNLLLQFFW
jgi:hypothetical protein